jgi:peptide-methionine (S)-S-oxide reductase
MSRATANIYQRVSMRVPDHHFVKGTSLQPPFPEQLQIAIFGRGCFWSVEKRFWEMNGVYSTAVGYAGGTLLHPTYSDVCSGTTGHAEVVQVVYDPQLVSYEQLLNSFWQGHNPGRSSSDDDSGNQYRSVIFTTTAEQAIAAQESLQRYERGLSGKGCVSTQIVSAPTFYYAEERHQQYSAKHSRR